MKTLVYKILELFIASGFVLSPLTISLCGFIAEYYTLEKRLIEALDDPEEMIDALNEFDTSTIDHLLEVLP